MKDGESLMARGRIAFLEWAKDCESKGVSTSVFTPEQSFIAGFASGVATGMKDVVDRLEGKP